MCTFAQRLPEDLAAAAHHGPGRLEEFVQWESGRYPAVTHGGERRNVLRQKNPRREDVAHYADGRARVEHAPHPGASVISNETADLGLAGRDRDPLEGDMDLAVIVAQVAVGRDGAQVDPLTDVGVAQESFMVLVRETVDDRVFNFAADPAGWSNGNGAPEVGERVGYLRRSNTGLRSW